MLLSRCCKNEVYTLWSNDYGAYYACERCHCACNTIDSSWMSKESHNDTRNDVEA